MLFDESIVLFSTAETLENIDIYFPFRIISTFMTHRRRLKIGQLLLSEIGKCAYRNLSFSVYLQFHETSLLHKMNPAYLLCVFNQIGAET